MYFIDYVENFSHVVWARLYVPVFNADPNHQRPFGYMAINVIYWMPDRKIVQNSELMALFIPYFCPTHPTGRSYTFFYRYPLFMN